MTTTQSELEYERKKERKKERKGGRKKRRVCDVRKREIAREEGRREEETRDIER